jgi:RNA polymerase sigma-70 factor (ECF subfamily)
MDSSASGPAGGSVDPTVSDERLLARFVAGQDEALGELARRHERAMIGLARGMLWDEGLAREAVQETWVRVIRFGSGYDGRASVKTWLYHILVNRCRDRLRSDRARSARERRRARDEAGAHGSEMDDRGALSERVRDAVRELEEPGRETVILCFHRGMTHREAADVLGVPIGTIKSRLHKAIGRLRERLAVEAGELWETPA